MVVSKHTVRKEGPFVFRRDKGAEVSIKRRLTICRVDSGWYNGWPLQHGVQLEPTADRGRRGLVNGSLKPLVIALATTLVTPTPA